MASNTYSQGYRDTWSDPVPSGFRLKRSLPLPILPVPPKPATFDACNGCGRCCINEICQLGRELFDGPAPCPALEYENGRFWCGLVRNLHVYVCSERDAETIRMQRQNAERLGVGTFCDSGEGRIDDAILMASPEQLGRVIDSLSATVMRRLTETPGSTGVPSVRAASPQGMLSLLDECGIGERRSR